MATQIRFVPTTGNTKLQYVGDILPSKVYQTSMVYSFAIAPCAVEVRVDGADRSVHTVLLRGRPVLVTHSDCR